MTLYGMKSGQASLARRLQSLEQFSDFKSFASWAKGLGKCMTLANPNALGASNPSGREEPSALLFLKSRWNALGESNSE